MLVHHASQYRFTSSGLKNSWLITVLMKLNSFCRTSLAKSGYQVGCAMTRPRKAKNGAVTWSISTSADFVKYRSQNLLKRVSKFPSNRPERCNEKKRKFIVSDVMSSA